MENRQIFGELRVYEARVLVKLLIEAIEHLFIFFLSDPKQNYVQLGQGSNQEDAKVLPCLAKGALESTRSNCNRIILQLSRLSFTVS